MTNPIQSVALKSKNYLRRVKRRITTQQEARSANSALQAIQQLVSGFDSKHIWVFFAGNAAQDFRGNPKYLFAYINNYRPDIFAWWLCDDEDTIRQIRNLGWHVFPTQSLEYAYLTEKTGVVVAEQVKAALPIGLSGCTYVNLWHGIGFKRVERRLFEGDIAPGLAKKYVANGTFYRDHMLMLAPSPTYEEEFALDCGVDEDKFIRAGYPRCLYQQNFKPVCTFDHDLRSRQGLDSSTRIVTYAPTFRYHETSVLSKAFPNLDELLKVCQQNNILFVFKMHPLMNKDAGFLDAKAHYSDSKNFFFWDNADDFYEVMPEIDCLIVDYSSIISDAVAMGVKHFIRYVYDQDEYLASDDGVHEGYFERTCGQVCSSFTDLIEALQVFDTYDESQEIERLSQALWSYSKGHDDFDHIISQALNFTVSERAFPTLYSFDVFDTLISRKVLDPLGIFYGVQEFMEASGDYPWEFIRRYPDIRHTAEMCEREFFSKSREWRDSLGVEVTLDDIFRRISSVYNLSDQQVEQLKTWELELELENVVPLPTQIDRLKALVSAGETVVLISDMYLPSSFVRKLLIKADPALTDVPLFVSNDYGFLKTTPLDRGNLYFEVYKSFRPYYDFEKWVHYGDNPNADYYRAKGFNINPRRIERVEFNDFQRELTDFLKTYDSYLVAAMQARMCTKYHHDKERLVISYISLCFVPYVDWVLRDALQRGYKSLYFVSRDGHHLKRIADAIINRRGLPIKTHYIYGSRRLWRLPSYIDSIDEDFWTPESGNFNNISTAEALLDAMYLNRETFEDIFPSIDLDTIDFTDRASYFNMIQTFKMSKELHRHILEVAAERRPIVRDYLLQECNPNEPLAVVEYYGRGYNQDCHLRLWRDAIGDNQASLPYYYARSILPSSGGSIRHNFSANNGAQYFIEAIFANMPYKSVEAYFRSESGTISVLKSPSSYDSELFSDMERLLPEIADYYASLELSHPIDTDRMLFDFVFDYYRQHRDDPSFANSFGALVDMTSMYGSKREFAPAYTDENLEMFSEGKIRNTNWIITSDNIMSATRTEGDTRRRFNELFQILPGEDIRKQTRALKPDELKTSRAYSKRYKTDLQRAQSWNKSYAHACERVSVQHGLALFVSRDEEVEKTLNYRLLADALCHYEGMTLKSLNVGNKGQRHIDADAELLARASCIVTSNPIPELALIKYREQTCSILAKSQPFSLATDGLSAGWWLKQRSRYVSTFNLGDYNAIQLPSPGQRARYDDSYCRGTGCDFSISGSIPTDVYFDGKALIYRDTLNQWFPEARDKKVILYMPVMRSSAVDTNWACLIDLEDLQSRIGKDYVVVLQVRLPSQARRYANVKDISGFCKVLIGSSPLTAREAMCAADIIVGDYRDTFFESVLLHKPIFSCGYDYEAYLSLPSRDIKMFDRPDDLLPGPIVKTSHDLANHIDHIDRYDYSKSEHMRKLLFESCRGASAESLADYMASWTRNHS